MIEMNEKMVSVVITTYKREIHYVEEALDSVLRQTYQPIEVILVDDNGKDSVYEKALAQLCAGHENVRYLPNEKNSGVQVSRNNGIRASKGEFVAFLDDDDLWREDKLEKQMALFTAPDVGMVYCDGDAFVDGSPDKLEVFREVSVFDRPITHTMELFNDFIGSTSQALVRRSVFENVGLFDPDMPARQDYEMWLRISRQYKIVGSPEKLLYYRIHPGERISTNQDKCIRSYELLLSKYSADFDSDTYAKAKLILRMFNSACRGKKYADALRYLSRAFFTNPRCVVDVIIRRLSGKSFSEFYQDRIRQL